MKKTLLLVIITLCVIKSPLAQSILLKENQSTVFLEGGVAGGEGLTAYAFGVGATYVSRLDVGLAIGKVTDGIGSAWSLSESFGFNIIRERLTNSTAYLSFVQTFTIIQQERAISLGGTFSHKFQIEKDAAIAYSLGASWLKPMNSEEDPIIVFPLQIIAAVGSDKSLFYLSPGIAFSNNDTVTYSFSIGLSFTQKKRNERSTGLEDS